MLKIDFYLFTIYELIQKAKRFLSAFLEAFKNPLYKAVKKSCFKALSAA